MKPSTLTNLIDRQPWLEPADRALGAVAAATLDRVGQPVRNFLHGTWLGHPLHSAITDVPVGAWSTAAVLDGIELLGHTERFAPGADAAVGVGLLGALGAAASGLCDWSRTDRPARRVGVLHALINISTLACYATSWWQRRSGDRRGGMVSGMTGFLLLLAGTYLGGHLSYDERIGVDHAQRSEGPEDWASVMPEADLPEGQLRRASVQGTDILLVKRNGRVFALGEKCAHLGGPLAEGKIENGSVICPWHGSRFALEDGRVLDGPALVGQPCYEARVHDGQIEIKRRGVRG
ncbi:MAG: Rieske 2Fe-2S domain-containing protein [Verrucomicrobia bacterium]|nr:Rieske 2Fe-2S domain-containing protein [Verrucomicrobiota bacterium]